MLAESESLSILSWNVWNDISADLPLRARLLLGEIEMLGPDVLLLQEMTTEMLLLLSGRLLALGFSFATPHPAMAERRAAREMSATRHAAIRISDEIALYETEIEERRRHQNR